MIFNTGNNNEVKKLLEYIDKAIEEGKIVELNDFEPRTLDQNAYLHVLLSLVASVLGYTLQETKEIVLDQCDFMRSDVFANGRIKTSLLSKSEFSDLIEWMIHFFGRLGVYLPDAEDYKNNPEEREKAQRTIKRNKPYFS